MADPNAIPTDPDERRRYWKSRTPSERLAEMERLRAEHIKCMPPEELEEARRFRRVLRVIDRAELDK